MKELSIEEKSKRYNEAIKRAKEQLDGAKVFDYNNEQIAHDIRSTVYNIFPELKESERIKKAIHIYLDWFDGRKDYAPKGEYSIRDMIAWLKKQGEQSSNILWHDVSEEPENNREIFCKWKGSEDNTWHDVVFYRTNDKTFWSGGKNQIKHVIEWAYVDDLLEKQDEQKPSWSEEDEHRAKDAIYFLGTAKKLYASTVEIDAWIDWIKSIRQRLGE